MPVSNVVDEQGFLVVDARKEHEAEVFREALSAMLIVERRNFPAQALLWIVMVLVASRLPNAEFFFLPLMLRLFALINIRFGAYWLGKRIQREKSISWALHYATLAMFIGGASWGLVLTAVMHDPVILSARIILGGGALIGVGVTVAIVCPVYRLLVSFLFGFMVASLVAMWWWSTAMLLPTTLAIACLTLIFLAFAYAMSTQHLLTARTLVENRLLSEELAGSLAHAEFLAFRDPLTGLMNRRAFFDFVGDYDADAERYLLFIDLDNFKIVNDHHGHATGDNVLVRVSRSIKLALTELPEGRHCAARMGGDEFVIVLDCADRSEAEKAAERLRNSIARIDETIDMPGLITTCSIGFTHWKANKSIDNVLFEADSALYQAKSRGRNRVENAVA